MSENCHSSERQALSNMTVFMRDLAQITSKSVKSRMRSNSEGLWDGNDMIRINFHCLLTCWIW
jgi:hypothetical protein